MRWHLRLGFTVLITLVWLSVGMAVQFVLEQPQDAGDLPSNASDTEQRCAHLAEPLRCAQRVTDDIDFNDGLMQISGRIASPDDVDMYEITISKPSDFSATTILVAGVSIEDSQLFLFDKDGKGICANEDNPDLPSTVPLRRFAALPRGACPLPPEPGTYFLAISTSVRDPVDQVGSEIFPDPVTDPERQTILVPDPNDPDVVVKNWVDTSQIGNYAIQLTGVNYPPPICGQTSIVEGEGRTRTFFLDVIDNRFGIQSVEVLDPNNLNNIEYIEIPAGSETDRFPRMGATGEIETVRTFPAAPLTNVVTIGAFSANKYAYAAGRVRVTNNVGGEIVCPFGGLQLQDLEPPQCCYKISLDADEPIIQVKAHDAESGIRAIYFDFLRNVRITTRSAQQQIPPTDSPPESRSEFTDDDRGKTFVFDEAPILDTLIIEVTRNIVDPSTDRATAVVFLFDANQVCAGDTPDTCVFASNVSSNCDPHIFDLETSPNNFMVRNTVTDLTKNDHHVLLKNQEPGLTVIALRANEGRLHARRLGDNDVQRVDTEADMIEGENSMHFLGIGNPRSKATVIISDREMSLETPASSSESAPLFQLQRQIQECQEP